MSPDAMALARGSGSGGAAAAFAQQGARDAVVLAEMMEFLADLRGRAAVAAEPRGSGASATIIEEHDDGDEAMEHAAAPPGGGPDAGAGGGMGGVQPRVTHEELRYTNGDVYKGEVLGGRLRHGAGTHEGADGSSYVGGWRLDQRHGRGVFTMADGTCYDGEWRGDKANGTGACTYTDGSRYEGDWEEDARCGWGRLDAADGQSYEGEWRFDTMHGQGKWRFAGGAGYFLGAYDRGERTRGKMVLGQNEEYEYNGEFKVGLCHGLGTAVRRGIYIYKGPFERDQRHGAGGECAYADGSRYTGDWSEDRRHGRGRMELGDGTVYEGEWRDDARHGEGFCRYGNGDRYSGSWAAGARAGEGRCVFTGGGKYAGAWADDQPEGLGAMAYANGDRYTGEWKVGKRHGVGLMVYADGASFKGRWEGGAWVQSAADPARCRLRGAGLARAVAGQAAAFRIQARDEDNNPRLSGGDTFVVTLLREVAPSPPAAAAAAAPAGASGQPSSTPAARLALAGGGGAAGRGEGEGGAGGWEEVGGPEAAPAPAPARLDVVAAGGVQDCGDGSYEVTYTLEAAGRHLVAVTDGDGAHVADSPYPILVLPGPPSVRRCTAEGPGRASAAAGAPAAFSVTARDASGNACGGLEAAALARALPLRARLYSGAAPLPGSEWAAGAGGGGGGGEVEVRCEAMDGGRWECEYTAALPGLHVLEVMALAPPSGVQGGGGGEGVWRHVRGSPFSVRVSAAPGARTAAAGAGASTADSGGAGATAGSEEAAAGRPRDVVSWWAEVARREYEAVDGQVEGFEGGAQARPEGAAATPEAAFVEPMLRQALSFGPG